MILYRPTDGEIHWSPIRWRPRCAFIMAQLGAPVPEVVVEIRRSTAQIAASVRNRARTSVEALLTSF